MPDHIATYINEHKINTASAAAILADEYILTQSRGLTASRHYGGTQRENFYIEFRNIGYFSGTFSDQREECSRERWEM